MHSHSHTHLQYCKISCVSSSADLTDRDRFRYYFQVLAPDDGVAYGFFEIIRRFGWQRIGIIAQNERLFTAVSILGKSVHIDGCF